MKKKVAIVQSNYIPWKGYFDLINIVDEFILHDDAQYTKQDWRNRNKIKTLSGLKWLTIPVRHQHIQKIHDVIISDSRWNRKHWNTIVSNYSKAKYFHVYKDLFEDLYLRTSERFLSQINYRFLSAICQILGISTKISWSMDYHIQETHKTEKVIALCKAAKATEYLSGPSAKAYLKEELFKQENITLKYMNYSGYAEYAQVFPPFEHGVSIIDLLFNTGKEAPDYLKSFRKAQIDLKMLK
jgi:hypothetical protein